MKKYLALSLFVLFALVLAACAPESTPEPTAVPVEPTPVPTEAMEEEVEEMEEAMPSIVDIAISDGRFTTLVTALQEAGLVEALQGEGPFTVFAPTDDAFAALPEGTLESLLADKEALSSVLLYHVVDGKNMAADVIALDGQEIPALSGEAILVKVEGDSAYASNALILITDIEAGNGVIHVVDSVMLPPSMMAEEEPMEEEMTEPMSIVDIAVADGRFTTLVTAVVEAGLAETLSGEGTFTVFAPTDDAFKQLPEGTIESLLADKEALTDVLLYHVLGSTVYAENVVALDGQIVETLQGQYLNVSVDDDAVMVDNAQVIITDIMASNGVIHVIDSVLLPETRTIAEIASETEGFSTLVAALEAADLVEALNGEGEFTVFAPTDDAFAALPEGALDGLLADIEALTNVLLYHVVDGKVMSIQVVELDGQEVETLSGQTILITVTEDGVKVNESMVIITDIEASNGVIHVIDAVLLPQ